MMRQSRTEYVVPAVVVIVLISLLFMGLWAIDISLSAAMMGARLTNGFITRNPIQMLHMGYYAVIGASVGLATLTVAILLRR
ncbi:hypothetical protein AKJ58_01505 [candidate division MSBL1 archaeon SCGC-AAA385D11]|uniref:Uncharacterized protein n=1 Tax=candidate division MSBL1 archaeon SCGC-AAA385D11 TaxID=1698286 RepID=A0A133VNB5_9EURY|nr:hypothetical protein AKJ58_01505 [candidate division MSBL1 archaeon SCGC-AAA385D11]